MGDTRIFFKWVKVSQLSRGGKGGRSQKMSLQTMFRELMTAECFSTSTFHFVINIWCCWPSPA
jgi:hypothetical protein